MRTIAQRKKYRCVTDRDQRCSVTRTTSRPERRQILIKTQQKQTSPGSKQVIILRRPSQPSSQQSPSSSYSSTKSLQPHSNSNPSNSVENQTPVKMKFSPDSFNFLTIPLKFFASLLSPFVPPTAKHNASSSQPLVNVHVPMTFSMVHSAAPVAYNPNSSPIYCHTQCVYTASNSAPIPCNPQPCSNANTSPTPTPPSACATNVPRVPRPNDINVLPAPCVSQPNDTNTTPVPCNRQPDNHVNTSPVPSPTPTLAGTPQPCPVNNSSPPYDPKEDAVTVPPYSSNNSTAMYILLCSFFKEIQNLTALDCNRTPDKLVKGTSTPAPFVTETAATEIACATQSPTTTTSTETSTTFGPSEPMSLPPAVPPPCTPPESILACLFALPKKICKPCTPSLAKPKPPLCKSHRTTSCSTHGVHATAHHRPLSP